MNEPQLIECFPHTILASASPRRAALLRQIGLDFQVYPSGVLEDIMVRPSPLMVTSELAMLKARAVRDRVNRGLIIAADTVVVINQQILGKPNSASHAIQILKRLSGTHHEVITGTVLLDLDRNRERAWTETTRVYFRELHAAEIFEYVRSQDFVDKAGGYGIQGRAGAFVSRIEGCYFNVVGLPLASLVERLWELARR